MYFITLPNQKIKYKSQLLSFCEPICLSSDRKGKSYLPWKFSTFTSPVYIHLGTYCGLLFSLKVVHWAFKAAIKASRSRIFWQEEILPFPSANEFCDTCLWTKLCMHFKKQNGWAPRKNVKQYFPCLWLSRNHSSQLAQSEKKNHYIYILKFYVITRTWNNFCETVWKFSLSVTSCILYQCELKVLLLIYTSSAL